MTDPPVEDPAAEIRRLRACMRDLVGLLAIPAAGVGRDPEDVAVTVLDMLVATLQLDLAFLQPDPSLAMPHFAALRMASRSEGALDRDAAGAVLDAWLADDRAPARLRLPGPGGGLDVAVRRVRLGLHDDVGMLVVATRRADFPTETEELLLRVASNHAAIALQEARRWREQQLLEERLEQRIAERTSQLSMAHEALRAARERQLEARFEVILNERTRLAREMHDTLLQGFTGIALQISAVAGRVSAPPEAAAALREVIALAQRTLTDARQAVWGLRAPATAAANFPAALHDVAEEAVQGTGVALSCSIADLNGATIEPDVEAAVLRVTQEALANVVRHARAEHADLTLTLRGSRLTLTVRDDGIGFAYDPDYRAYGAHWGLIGMRERAIQLRGALTVSSTPGEGTEVVLSLPMGMSDGPSPRASPPNGGLPTSA